MMRSLYSGVAGLQNHQVRMDVLGNNIANVNTIGFKRGRVNFQDMLSQNLQGAASPTEERGGVNPRQVGLGMTIASIDTIHTQGSLQTTGVSTDLSIQGNGFFLLQAGERTYYTRAGNFGLDEEGRLVNPANGMRVQGWTAQVVGGESYLNPSGDVGDIMIPVGGKDPARATGEVWLACNLNKATPLIPEGAGIQDQQAGTVTVTKEIYDTFGQVHTLQLDFVRLPPVEGEPIQNRWQVTSTVDPQAEIPTNAIINVGPEGNATNVFTVEFDNNGLLAAVRDAQGDVINNGNLNLQVAFDVAGGNVPEGQAAYRQNMTLNLGEVGSYTSAVTQFAETSSTRAFRQDGYAMGYLEGFQIDQNGVVTGVYSNGSSRQLAQVALATFTNPGGLEHAGDSTFILSNNSGDPNVGTVGTAGRGVITSGALEMSNVDLAEQFTDMIVTQRGFQANSRTITTADQLLQEILTLKR